MGAYRPVDFIYLIAFFIVELLIYVTKYLKESNKINIKVFLKKLLISIAIFLILVASNNIIRKTCDFILKNAMNIEEFDDRLSGYGYVFYVDWE